MKTALFFILAGSLYPLKSSAQVVNTTEELMRLQKCYALFVRERISAKDPLWIQVQNKTKTGTAACMEIFDRAKLGANGEIKKLSNGSYDYEGMQVLNTFLRFHTSQLSIPDYGPLIGYTNERFTPDVTDSNAVSYHFLYSLFAKDAKYSDVFTKDHSFRAVRYTKKSTRNRSVFGVAMPAFQQGAYMHQLNENGAIVTVPNPARGGVSDFTPTLVETGILVGLVPDDVDNSISTAHDTFINSGFGFTSLNVTQHLGGGVLGTQSYLMANLGKDEFANGGTNLQRRWGKNLLSDFLCRELPALRSKDVIPEVDPESTIAYRTGISCMACHSAMDPLAGAVRNMRANWTHNAGDIGQRVKFIGERTPDLGAMPFPSKVADGSFHRRPAEARLFYRSYDGSLVHKEMEGLNELGASMAETNDLYVCAAKRYYHFLTGINVSLADIGDINTPTMTTGEQEQRERVIDLGLKLKEHQSLRTLIQSIIQSRTFIYPDQGV